MGKIIINEYVYFNPENGWFMLESETSEIIYRQKNVICSYSGSNEWCNHFACELIDLYSGCSIYNYSLGTVWHEKRISELYKAGNKENVIEWIEKSLNKDWFKHAFDTMKYVIDNLVEV